MSHDDGLISLASVSVSRRALFRGAAGLGAIALPWLLRASSAGAAPIGRARSVVMFFMKGGPSQMDLFDPKPVLSKMDGQPAPFDVIQRSLKGTKRLMGSRFKFTKHGESGVELSELVPGVAAHADDIALVRSATTTRFDHDQAEIVWLTGRGVAGFPTSGAWVSYGLGRMNDNLPAYVAMGTRSQDWSSAFLPPIHQGTPMRPEGTPIFDLQPPAGLSGDRQQRLRRALDVLNRRHAATRPASPELSARIANFELAARMQIEAAQVTDTSGETERTRQLYGIDREETRVFGSQCLLARRLVERGVRFVHIVDERKWDHHSEINKGLPKECLRTDRPVAGLLSDLKGRGLLDQTLVVWAGEFGRLPTVEGTGGRDHNPFAFSLWMAGGGVKGGVVYGATDDFGYRAVENVVTIADLHATILTTLGLDPNRLTFEFEGRAESLIGVNPAKVIREILVGPAGPSAG